MNAPPAIARAEGLADWIAPGRTAVVVIDMQVDFASPEGALGSLGIDLSSVPPALAAAERLVAAARTVGAPVVFVALMSSPGRDSLAWAERLRRCGVDPATEIALCRAGERGSQFVGPTPEPGEPVVAKTRYSGFFGAGLDAILRDLGVDTLIACGLTTECCVSCTAYDAFHRDYHVFVAADACAAYDPDVHQAALKNLALNCAILTDTDRIVAAWRGEG